MKSSIKYDNIIMSWSCFGDFVLVSQSIKTLINDGQVVRGVIITHQKELRGLLAAHENIKLVYPTSNLKDLLFLISLFFKKNIFILHDMPSHNKFSKQIRMLMSVFLTRMRSSRMLLMLDDSFLPDTTTRVSEKFADSVTDFKKSSKIHISQYILDLLSNTNITKKVICDYDLEFTETYIKIDELPENESYIAVHPFASNMDKSMSVKWWIEYINIIHNTYPEIHMVLVGAPKDVKNAEEIVAHTKNVISMCGKTVFANTLYIIKNAKISINVDSGPAHFASFYKKLQIVLSTENQFPLYLPSNNENALFVFNDDVFTVDDVFDEKEFKVTEKADLQNAYKAFLMLYKK